MTLLVCFWISAINSRMPPCATGPAQSGQILALYSPLGGISITPRDVRIRLSAMYSTYFTETCMFQTKQSQEQVRTGMQLIQATKESVTNLQAQPQRIAQLPSYLREPIALQ